MARPGEASEEERQRFANALRPYLDGPNAVSQLAAELGVDRNTVYLWRDGKREPQRRQVFNLERVLGLPGGALSHLLGYLPSGAWGPEGAIQADPALSPHAKRGLVAAYRAALKQR